MQILEPSNVTSASAFRYVFWYKKTWVKTYLISKIYGLIRRQNLFALTSVPLVSILMVEKGSCSKVISLYSLSFSG